MKFSGNKYISVLILGLPMKLREQDDIIAKLYTKYDSIHKIYFPLEKTYGFNVRIYCRSIIILSIDL